jgi:hypothetical protein
MVKSNSKKGFSWEPTEMGFQAFKNLWTERANPSMVFQGQIKRFRGFGNR